MSLTREEMESELDRLLRKQGNLQRRMVFGEGNRKAHDIECDNLAAAIASIRRRLKRKVKR